MGRQLLLAAQFLTVLPLPSKAPICDADLGSSMRYYPLIGLVLGAVLAASQWFLSQWLPAFPVATISLVLLVILSGALHLDGFADMCDGFYKGKNKEEILAIMKDSHVGAMAVIGITCLFSLKLSFLWSLPQTIFPHALALMPAAGRWAMALLAATSPYARGNGGTAKAFVNHAGLKEAAIATSIVLPAGWLLLGERGILILLAVSIFTFIFRQYALSKIQGVTGDILGACGEMSEGVFLFCVCLGYGTR